jgi:predicted Zn-dependent protease
LFQVKQPSEVGSMTLRGLTAVACILALVALPLASRDGAAQIITTQKDVEAELRVQWMMLKRNTPHHPSERVQRLAQCIAFSIIDQIPEELQNLDWEIIVFDDEMRNAMVTPEGKIAVFGGLLDVADTPDKLAAVLGHEVAHLTQDHVKERIGRARMTGAFGALGGAVTGVDSSGMAAVLLQFPFQREQETEADVVGMSYMARAGYNPSVTIELWRAMGGGDRFDRRNRPPEWLSTHPDPELRMTDIARNLSPALVEYNNALDAGVRPRCAL